jgi:hypothetical protein
MDVKAGWFIFFMAGGKMAVPLYGAIRLIQMNSEESVCALFWQKAA